MKSSSLDPTLSIEVLKTNKQTHTHTYAQESLPSPFSLGSEAHDQGQLMSEFHTVQSLARLGGMSQPATH